MHQRVWMSWIPCGQVALRLVTNVVPGQPEQQQQRAAGSSWQYSGSIALVKSALQKNVRLGRAAEAVRCAWALLNACGCRFQQSQQMGATVFWQQGCSCVSAMKALAMLCAGAPLTCWPKTPRSSCAGPPSSPWR